MIKFLLFALAFFALGFFVQQGAYDTGEVVVRWYGYEARMQATFLAAVIAFFCILFFFWGQLWAFIVQAPKSLEAWRYKKRYEQGFDYFLEGLEALNAGENKLALKLSNKVQRLLPDPRISNILSAGSVASQNEPQKAIEHYKELSKSSKGQFIGLKGLIEQSSVKGSWHDVKNYAEQAYIMKPKNAYIVDQLFHAYLHIKEFDKALKFIPTVQKYGSYTSEKLDEYESFIYIEKSQGLDFKNATKFLEKALKVNKACVPALLTLVDISIRSGDVKKTLKLLTNFFHHTPHIQVYEKWVSVIQNEDAKYYKRRLKTLIKGLEKEFIGQFIQAKECIRQVQYVEALAFLDPLQKNNDCREVQVLIATVSSFIEGAEDKLQSALLKLDKIESFTFEGEASIHAYQNWQKDYTLPAQSDIAKPQTKLKLLTKRG
tara:strand:+ start:119603 stop:120895 length:1293 start_codon:yes stop_codon:yes gene_type:complete